MADGSGSIRLSKDAINSENLEQCLYVLLSPHPISLRVFPYLKLKNETKKRGFEMIFKEVS